MGFLGDLFGGGTKGPTPVALPNQADASAKAAATIADQRAALLASGGQTDYTGGLGILTGSDISKNSLTGI